MGTLILAEKHFALIIHSTVKVWPRGVVVNMSPCHGEDHRFDPGRGRQTKIKSN